MANNRILTQTELQAIRTLSDFDLTMLISETHDHGWNTASGLLRMMPDVRHLFETEGTKHEAS